MGERSESVSEIVASPQRFCTVLRSFPLREEKSLSSGSRQKISFSYCVMKTCAGFTCTIFIRQQVWVEKHPLKLKCPACWKAEPCIASQKATGRPLPAVWCPAPQGPCQPSSGVYSCQVSAPSKLRYSLCAWCYLSST